MPNLLWKWSTVVFLSYSILLFVCQKTLCRNYFVPIARGYLSQQSLPSIIIVKNFHHLPWETRNGFLDFARQLESYSLERWILGSTQCPVGIHVTLDCFGLWIHFWGLSMAISFSFIWCLVFLNDLYVGTQRNSYFCNHFYVSGSMRWMPQS